MKKILYLIFSFSAILFSQDYYNVELDNTGISQLTIFQDTITGLEIGDEIGVFDANAILNSGDCSSETGELLVGAGIWTGEQLDLVSVGSVDNCAFGGFQLPGFVEGNPLTIRVYRASENIEYITTAAIIIKMNFLPNMDDFII